MENLRKSILAPMPVKASANAALAVNIREQKSAEREVAKIKEEEKQEAELVASLNDGSYFESSSTDESSAGGAPEETAESVGESEEVAPGVNLALASDDWGEYLHNTLLDIAANTPTTTVDLTPPQSEPASEESPEQPKSIKQRFFAVMDWLTEDQARLTVVLTVFCMSVYLIVKLVKK